MQALKARRLKGMIEGKHNEKGNEAASEKSSKLICIGAGDGTRTRDTLLGRQELYH
jgi:hypothetical protein